MSNSSEHFRCHYLYLLFRASVDQCASYLVCVSYKGIKQWDFRQYFVQNVFRSILSPRLRRLTSSSVIMERSSERILSLWVVITTESISDKILMSSKYYIFWDVTKCSLVNVYWLFRRTICQLHQGWWKIRRTLKTGADIGAGVIKVVLWEVQ
jgi:hypothetical protein